MPEKTWNKIRTVTAQEWEQINGAAFAFILQHEGLAGPHFVNESLWTLEEQLDGALRQEWLSVFRALVDDDRAETVEARYLGWYA